MGDELGNGSGVWGGTLGLGAGPGDEEGDCRNPTPIWGDGPEGCDGNGWRSLIDYGDGAED